VSDPQHPTDETHKVPVEGDESWNETEDIPPAYFAPEDDEAPQDSPSPRSGDDDGGQNAG
jgi:hypothetical protein